MTWFSRPLRILVFGCWFARAIVVSSLVVLHDNLSFGQNSAPGIARYPTRCRSDGELTLLAALITLTPGTLTVGTETTRDGRRVLFVHGMYNTGADDLRAEIAVMESRMLHAVRRTGRPS